MRYPKAAWLLAITYFSDMSMASWVATQRPLNDAKIKVPSGSPAYYHGNPTNNILAVTTCELVPNPCHVYVFSTKNIEFIARTKLHIREYSLVLTGWGTLAQNLTASVTLRLHISINGTTCPATTGPNFRCCAPFSTLLTLQPHTYHSFTESIWQSIQKPVRMEQKQNLAVSSIFKLPLPCFEQNDFKAHFCTHSRGHCRSHLGRHSSIPSFQN